MEKIDWGNLTFGYTETSYNVRIKYRNGVWGEIEESNSAYIPIHIAATCLHYGQEAFEGVKAFRGIDGKVRIFRMRTNAERLQSSCRATLMPELPVETFCGMVERAIKLNSRYIPPYGTGAALYIRPLLIGTGPQVGVKPSEEYTCIIFVTPAGPYQKEFRTSNYALIRSYDRAAPLGTGSYKVGGNYAAGLRADKIAHEAGYSGALYLDSKEKRYIDEFSSANFIGIKGNSYITPKSDSILPSVTNRSLMQIAADNGMDVEVRRIPVEELTELDEAGACGTAAVILPVERIDDIDTGRIYVISKDGMPGPVLTRLYHQLQDIQYGIAPDPYGWTTEIDV